MYEIEEDDTIHEMCEKVFDTTISETLMLDHKQPRRT